MSEYRDPQEAFVDTLRAEMPPTAGEDATSRVRARVLASRSTHRSPALRRPWRVAGSLAATVAVIAVGVLLLAPRMETAAFARERAVSALMLHVNGRVLHLELAYTQADQHDPSGDTNQKWSVWVDAEGKRIREEFVNSSDGSLDELRVRAANRAITYLSDARYKQAQLVEQDMTTQPVETAVDEWIDYIRARIADGSAKVTGTQTIDGDECWVVKWKSDEGDIVVTVTMRKSDYRLKTWAQDVTSVSDGGSSAISKRATLEVVEQLDPGTLPSDFFSLDAVKDAAKPGTPVQKP